MKHGLEDFYSFDKGFYTDLQGFMVFCSGLSSFPTGSRRAAGGF